MPDVQRLEMFHKQMIVGLHQFKHGQHAARSVDHESGAAIGGG